MSRSIPSRRIVALAAAYVVALQMLLLPLSVAAGISFAGGLCTASAGQAQTPASHESACPCAAGCGTQCCAQALLVPPQISAAVAMTMAGEMAPALALKPTVLAADRSPQNPRAPPAS